MLGIGFFEIVVIALVCLMVFGPEQLPSMMRAAAKWYQQFTSLRDELRFQLMSAEGDDKKPPLIVTAHEENAQAKIKDAANG